MSMFNALFSGLVHANTTAQASPTSNGLQRQTVTGMTRHDAITPHNLRFSSTQTAAVIPNPRYATEAEAWATGQLKETTIAGLKHANKMYSHLEQIDTADTALHVRHNRYQGRLMANEGKRQHSNAKLASAAQGQRIQQATIAGAYDLSVNRANRNIEAINQTVAEMGVKF